MADLPDKWQEIMRECGSASPLCTGGIRKAVERCYALTQKPVRELTDGEILGWRNKTWIGLGGQFDRTIIQFAHDILAAHQRKQQEPEAVTFRAARHKEDGRLGMIQADMLVLPSVWEWLEPAQTIEVKLP